MAGLTIYSPAPPSTPLHIRNAEICAALADAPGVPPLVLEAIALPDSINRLTPLPASRRRAHLPIVTTVDLRLSRTGAGPEWHHYDLAHSDLKFLAKLYDVGFGIQSFSPDVTSPGQLRGKRIGAPARPSAVRLLTETLLRDGWGILDDVTLIDIAPRDVAAARTSGEIDATSWNLVSPVGGAMMPMLPLGPAAHFIPIAPQAIERINAANVFQLERLDGALLGFSQALTAWDNTGSRDVTALLHGLESIGLSASSMAAWPDLRRAETHSAAVAFYETRSVIFRA